MGKVFPPKPAPVTADATYRGRILGHVLQPDTNRRASGATVTDGTRTATTNAHGVFVIPEVPPGSYHVTASLEGYFSTTSSNTVKVADRDEDMGPIVLGYPTKVPVADQLPRTLEMPSLHGHEEKYHETVRRVHKRGGRISALFRPPVGTLPFVRTLGVRPTDVIADVGAGTGALEMALLEHKIPLKKIVAVDINKRAVDFVRFMARATGLDRTGKLQVVQSMSDDPRLPPGQIDLAMIINVSDFAAARNPKGKGLLLDPGIKACYQGIRKSLKPGGRLLVYYELGSKWDRPQARTGARREDRVYLHPLAATGFRVVRKDKIEVGGVRYLRIEGRPGK